MSNGGCTNNAVGVLDWAARFSDVYNKHQDQLKEKASKEGFAPMDLMLNVNGGKRLASSSDKASVTYTSDLKADYDAAAETQLNVYKTDNLSGKVDEDEHNNEVIV